MSTGARRASLFLGAVLVSLATRWVTLAVDLVHTDEAAHLLGSWTLLDGGTLYVDYVDNKPPLLYAYYALAQLLFGRGLFAVHLFTALLVVPLTAWGISALFRHDRRGVAAGLLYLIFSASSFKSKDMLAANCELLMLAPAVWALVLIRDEQRAARWVAQAAAGVLMGLAFLFKQHAASWLPILPVAAWLAGGPVLRRLALALAAGAGFALPLAATWAVFDARGHAAEMVYWTFTYNVEYSQNPMLVSELFVRVAKKLVPWLLVTTGLWWAAGRSWPMLGRYQRGLFGWLIVLSLPAAFVGWRMYPHYFLPLLVPLAAAAAPWVAAELQPPLSRLGRIAVAYGAAVAIGFAALNTWQLLLHNHDPDERHAAFAQVADRLRADGCYRDDATLYVWGVTPTFYYVTGLRPASRFALPQGTVSGYICGNYAVHQGRISTKHLLRADHQALLLADLETRRATYLIDTTGWPPASFTHFPLENVPGLREYVDQRYTLLADLDGILIYRRNDCAAPARK